MYHKALGKSIPKTKKTLFDQSHVMLQNVLVRKINKHRNFDKNNAYSSASVNFTLLQSGFTLVCLQDL